MKPEIDVVNVVATATISDTVNLDRACTLLDKVKYKPKSFPGLVMRLKNPRCTILVFKTGKVVCSGASNIGMAQAGVERVTKILHDIGVDTHTNPQVTITNVVAAVNLGREIRIEKAALSVSRSMYEPEMFPGIIYREVDPKCVLLIFASGRMVCAGATNEADIHRAVNQMYMSLESKGLFFN